MKKLLLSAFLMGFASLANAQMQDRHAELPDAGSGVLTSRVDDMTRQMVNRLRLNEAQYIRLRAANQIKVAKADEIQWQYSAEPVVCQGKLAELEQQYEQECSRILTPSQLSLMHEQDQHDAVPATLDPNQNGLG